MKCRRCGAGGKPGAVFYAFEFRLYADYDGIVDPSDEADLERATEAASREEARNLEDQVILEGRVVLCPACRRILADFLSALGRGEAEKGEERSPGEEKETVH